MNDEKALRAIGRGDEDALAWVIDRYAAYVSAVVFNILGAAMQTEDLEETVSDVFLALWANSGKVKPGKLKAYLGRHRPEQGQGKAAFRLHGDIP